MQNRWINHYIASCVNSAAIPLRAGAPHAQDIEAAEYCHYRCRASGGYGGSGATPKSLNIASRVNGAAIHFRAVRTVSADNRSSSITLLPPAALQVISATSALRRK